MAQLFKVRLVLLEFSPRDGAVFVRGVWAEGKQMHLAPVHEDNRQELIRVMEGVDNLANASAFAVLGLRARGE